VNATSHGKKRGGIYSRGEKKNKKGNKGPAGEYRTKDRQLKEQKGEKQPTLRYRPPSPKKKKTLFYTRKRGIADLLRG